LRLRLKAQRLRVLFQAARTFKEHDHFSDKFHEVRIRKCAPFLDQKRSMPTIRSQSTPVVRNWELQLLLKTHYRIVNRQLMAARQSRMVLLLKLTAKSKKFEVLEHIWHAFGS
jgi:hypothetical protein